MPNLTVQPIGSTQGISMPEVSSESVDSSTSTPQPTPPQSTTKSGQLDPTIVNLTKAIRKVESNNNFQAKGKSGEYGAYQFMPNTWKSSAQKYLGQDIPLEEATPEQQNEVAYKKIADWKAAGFNVGQIASMWNAGGGKPNAYIEGNAGTNSLGVHYDTAAYAKKVATAYQDIKANNPGFNPTPFSDPTTGIVETGNKDNSHTSPGTSPGTYPNSDIPLTIGPVKAGFEQTGEALGNTIKGMAKAGVSGANAISKSSQGLMHMLTPWDKNQPASLNPDLMTPSKAEQPGFIGAKIGAPLVGGEVALEELGSSLPAVAGSVISKIKSITTLPNIAKAYVLEKLISNSKVRGAAKGILAELGL